MRTAKRWLLLALPVLLAGCLEVDQHPPWVKGKYSGKRDQQPYETHFHGDRLSWWATLSNRALRQNEYNRAKPLRPPVQAYEMQRGVPPQAPAQLPGSSVQRAQVQREQVRQVYTQQARMPQDQAAQAPAPQGQAPQAPAQPPAAPPPARGKPQGQAGKGG